MSSDPRLAALPALRKRAEEEARERVVTFARLEGADCAPDGDVATVAAVELSLLSDLTRPESRDAVARLVAEALGMVNPPTAPSFRRYDAAGSPMPTGDGGLWTLYGNGDHEGQWHPFETWRARPGRFYAPEIAATTDPTEALTLIALAVLGGAS